MRTLEEMFCFDLYAASRAVTAMYRPLLDDLGLTYPQYLVLLTLPAHDALSVKQLAARLDLDHGTLSPLLRRMESAGLVSRTRSSADERVVEVRLAERGEQLRTRFEEVQCEVEDSLGLSKDEVAELQRTLKSMTARVRERAAGAASRSA